MIKTDFITKGFSATKGNITKDVIVEVHSMGFYINTYTNLAIDNCVPRNTLKKAIKYVEEIRRVLIKKKFTIGPDRGTHKVKYNDKTLTFNTLLE